MWSFSNRSTESLLSAWYIMEKGVSLLGSILSVLGMGTGYLLAPSGEFLFVSSSEDPAEFLCEAPEFEFEEDLLFFYEEAREFLLEVRCSMRNLFSSISY